MSPRLIAATLFSVVLGALVQAPVTFAQLNAGSVHPIVYGSAALQKAVSTGDYLSALAAAAAMEGGTTNIDEFRESLTNLRANSDLINRKCAEALVDPQLTADLAAALISGRGPNDPLRRFGLELLAVPAGPFPSGQTDMAVDSQRSSLSEILANGGAALFRTADDPRILEAVGNAPGFVPIETSISGQIAELATLSVDGVNHEAQSAFAIALMANLGDDSVSPDEINHLVGAASRIASGLSSLATAVASGATGSGLDATGAASVPPTEFRRAIGAAQGASSFINMLARATGDPDFVESAATLSIYTDGAVRIAQLYEDFDSQQITAAVLSFNVVEIATALIPELFAGSGSDAQIKAQLKALREQIDALEDNMNVKFRLLDERLQEMQSFNERMFERTEADIHDLRQDVASLRSEVEQMQRQMDRWFILLDYDLNETMADNERREFLFFHRRAFVTREIASEDSVKLAAAKFEHVALDLSIGNAFTRRVLCDSIGISGEWLTVFRQLNCLAMLAGKRGNAGMLEEVRVLPGQPEPILPHAPTWQLGAEAYVSLATLHPDWAPPVATTDLLIQAGEDVRLAIHRSIWQQSGDEWKLREDFVGSLVDDYVSKLGALGDAVVEHREKFRESRRLPSDAESQKARLIWGERAPLTWNPAASPAPQWPTTMIAAPGFRGSGFPQLAAPACSLFHALMLGLLPDTTGALGYWMLRGPGEDLRLEYQVFLTFADETWGQCVVSAAPPVFNFILLFRGEPVMWARATYPSIPERVVRCSPGNIVRIHVSPPALGGPDWVTRQWPTYQNIPASARHFERQHDQIVRASLEQLDARGRAALDSLRREYRSSIVDGLEGRGAVETTPLRSAAKALDASREVLETFLTMGYGIRMLENPELSKMFYGEGHLLPSAGQLAAEVRDSNPATISSLGAKLRERAVSSQNALRQVLAQSPTNAAATYDVPVVDPMLRRLRALRSMAVAGGEETRR